MQSDPVRADTPALSWRKAHERGSSLILFTLITMLVLIPMIGLAVDGATLFWAKAKLSAAVDAAALAAGRNPAADPQVTAVQYVDANFPPGWLNSSFVSGPTAVVDFPTTGTRRVTVTASVSVPLSFMRILGVNNSTLGVSAASSRRDANIFLVLDRSSSMNITGPDGSNVCQTMKASAQTFVNYFANGRDQLTLISFTAGAHVDFAPSKLFQSSTPNLNSYIGQLACGSNTSSAMALNLAYAEIQSLGSAAFSRNGALNVIVFFTDGQPNGITANFPVRTLPDNRYDPVNYSVLQSPLALGSKYQQCANLPGATPPGTMTGVIAQWAGGAVPTGETVGLMQTDVPNGSCGNPICNGDNVPLISAPSCLFGMNNNGTYMRQDIAYIPLKDAFGNSTNNPNYMTQAGDWVTTGPYASPANQGFRTDIPRALVDAAFNAADDQAQKIIHDRFGYDPVIYTLGLGGAKDAPTEDVFQRFLRRVANDPKSDIYDPSRPRGMFVYSPNDTQLAAAFQQIASQILRLSQ
jgi:Flp pilus assembly protein TadG